MKTPRQKLYPKGIRGYQIYYHMKDGKLIIDAFTESGLVHRTIQIYKERKKKWSADIVTKSLLIMKKLPLKMLVDSKEFFILTVFSEQ